MNTATKIIAGTLVLTIACGMATAQQTTPPAPAPTPAAAGPSPPSTPQIDAGEPRANGAAPAAGAGMAAQAADTVAAGPVPPRAVAKPAAGVRGQAAGTGAVSLRGNAADRLNLNTTTVTGDHEQPKVMYVVPWKSANIGDLSGKPMNSLLDEVLAPVDREEFRREVAYYDAVTAPAPQAGQPKPPAGQAAR